MSWVFHLRYAVGCREAAGYAAAS